MSNDFFTLISPKGIALGLVPDKVFNVLEERTIQLHQGDRAILYTDGVIEAANENDEEYCMEHFLTTMTAVPNASSSDMINCVMKDIEKFTAGADQQDDITMIAIRVCETNGSSA